MQTILNLGITLQLQGTNNDSCKGRKGTQPKMSHPQRKFSFSSVFTKKRKKIKLYCQHEKVHNIALKILGMESKISSFRYM